ncbi:MAG: septum formation initiator family protein [Syntrophaceae bacterium]|nr:septum formation initiator family protein [Syntrophaceae bacterium]
MRIGRYLLLIILFVGFFIVFGNRGLLDNQRLKQKLADLRAENARLEAVNNSLKREALLIREEPRYIESVARQELGMVKRGELIYRFVEPAASTPPSGDGSPPQATHGPPAGKSGAPM